MPHMNMPIAENMIHAKYYFKEFEGFIYCKHQKYINHTVVKKLL